ncbi:MAG: hypothetical protein FCO83_02655 [Spiroplasma sp. WSS]|uniref:hypothetical protein n=1 Tax=unclassified Spiroplasma TaxID=2637901 RepID=UPI00121D44BC|nr:hypothetical protein [Spiroplasma endosymbiont of Lariophagus distinguendus]TLF25501.1 MAG: hypothetical protein FCO83_02655 [Spiroplasma sp. WSS]WDA54725.1 MAG: hypothetical protein PPFGHCPK_01189 [Spiroplasma endosymbiont of Drosophila atripex]
MGNLSSQWWMLALIGVVLIIFIFTTISAKKKKKEEKKQRQKEVKNIIKSFMRDELKLQHKTVEFEQVVSRSSKEYRYRDVFDVIVKLYDSKKNDLFATKAFEVEGFTKQLSKKEFETIWKVNCELDLEETLKKIEMSKKRSGKIKIKRKTAEEKAAIKKENEAVKLAIEEERLQNKENKKRAKNLEKPKIAIHDKFSGWKDK